MKFTIQTAQIEVLANCNFKCRHCSNAVQPKEKYILPDQFSIIMDQLCWCGVKTVVLSGGEPTIHPEIKKLISCSAAKQVDIQLNTNGYLLCDYLNFLKDYKNMVSIQVSLDGYDKDTFQYIRDVDAFDRVINSITQARMAGLKVIIKAILSRKTYQHYAKFVELAQTLDADLSIGFMSRRGRALENPEIALNSEEILSTYYDFLNYAKGNERVFIQSGIFKDDHCPLIFSPGVISTLRITNEGECFPCLAFADKSLSMGNIFDKPLELMLDDYEKYRKVLLDALYNPDCIKCGDRKRAPRPGCIISCDYFSDKNCNYGARNEKIQCWA
jgi:radical SAM protein with 4Fe4S-binding SPASM domain